MADSEFNYLKPFKVKKIIDKLNEINSSQKFLEIFKSNDDAIGEKIATNLLEYRKTLGKFSTLEELQKVPGIGKKRLQELVDGVLTLVDPPNRTPPIMRARIAKFFRKHLATRPVLGNLLASDTLEASMEILVTALQPDVYGYFTELLQEAINMEAVTLDERIMDVVHFSQMAAYRAAPPQGLFDPAQLPETHPETKWARSCDLIYIFSDHPITLEILADRQWETVQEFSQPLAFVPTVEGLSVRTVMQGPLAPVGVGKTLITSQKAYRLRCESGMRGVLTGKTTVLNGNPEDRPSTPLGWSHPNTDIWVNPRPESPIDFGNQTEADELLPGEVLIAGRKKEAQDAEEIGGKVLVGFYPRVAIAVWPQQPWPWGPYRWPWPLPWPPGPGGGPGPGPGPGGLGIVLDPDPNQAVTVKIMGCPCIRRPETKTYRADPNPDGGTYQWTIDDTSIAEIDGPDNQQEVQVKAIDIGDITLTVKYVLNGQTARASMGVEVIYQKFTEKNRPASEISAVPLFQPVPKVRVRQGSPTHKLHTIEPENRRAKFLVDFEGKLFDALIDIEEVEITSGSGFKQKLSKTENEFGRFDNEKFSAKKMEVYGPGRSYFRIKARNSLGFVGTETFEIIITVRDHYYSSIRDFERRVAFSKQHGNAQDVQRDEARLVEVWESALEFVIVRYGYLSHSDNSGPIIPGNEKWSVAVEDDETMGFAEIVTSHDAQSVFLEEKRKGLLAPKTDPKNYFVLYHEYMRDRVTWEDDGMLKGKAGQPASLIYLDPCCSLSIPVVGVEITKLPGIQRIKKDEAITLDADGLPPSFLGINGIYEWSVSVQPEGADFRFEPNQPSSSSTVEFFTDTPGLYTFKVKYALLGATSPWTYAEVDSQIIFQVETETVLERIGPYTDTNKQHQDRPYYRERTITPQFGAEIKIKNKEEGPLGKDLEIKVLCHESLEFVDTLKARANFLHGDYEDFTLLVDPDFNFVALAEIRSMREIQSLHIIGIQYRNLPRFPGTAVWVDVQVKNLEPPIIDLEMVEQTSTVANGSQPTIENSTTLVAIDSNGKQIDLFKEEEGVPSKPLVNLIIKPRDLGPASACNANIEWFPMHTVNLTNGNHYQDLSLYETDGHGENASASLHYNSQAALRSHGLKTYGQINEKTEEQVAQEFGHEPFGIGWSGGPMAMMLWEFIDPDGTDIEHRRLNDCIEVIMSDGNRIAFKREFSGKYTTYSDAETDDDNADEALNLELTWDTTEEQWKMTNEEEQYWLFDKEGKLIERGSALTAHTQTKALRISHGNQIMVIEDSMDRRSEFHMIGQTVWKIVDPNGMAYVIEHDNEGHLKKVTLDQSTIWGYEYGKDGLMAKIMAPEGHAMELTHYLGEEVETVVKNIARNFWGRVARLQFNARRWSLRYGELLEKDQVVACLDPEDHRWRYTYDPKRQAATRIEYANNEAVVAYRHYEAYKYREDSKGIKEYTGLPGAVTKYYYRDAQGRQKGMVLSSMHLPGRGVVNYNYDSKNRLASVLDETNKTTLYTYTDFRSITKKTYPSIPILTVDLSESSAIPFEENSYDDYGRPLQMVSVLGVATTFNYQDAETGLPTHITLGGSTKVIKYDKMGRLIEEVSTHGLIIKNRYTDLGWNDQTIVGNLKINRKFDKLGRMIEESDDLDRKILKKYDNYHQLIESSDAEENKHTYNTYDKSGFLRKETFPNDAEYHYFSVDALGRRLMTTYPNVARNLPDNNLETENLADQHTIFVDELSPHPLLNEEVYEVETSQGLKTKVSYFNGGGLLRAEASIIEDQIVTKVFKYDPKGRMTLVEWYDGSRRKGTLETQSWNALDEVYWQRSGGVEKRVCKWFDQEGVYMVEKYIAQQRQTGRAPSTLKRLDDLGRILKEYDGSGRLVTEYEYDDQLNTCQIKTADPSNIGDDLVMVDSLYLTYNTFGKIARQEDKRTQEVNSYQFDKAGRAISMTNRLGTTNFKYDKLNRIIELTSPVPGASGAVATPPNVPNVQTAANTTQTTVTKYDALGNKTQYGTDSADVKTTYDRLGRPQTITKTGLGSNQTLTEEIAYNEEGEIIARSHKEGEVTYYQHNYKFRHRVEILNSEGDQFVKITKLDGLGRTYQTNWRGHGGSWEFTTQKDAAGRLHELKLKQNDKLIWEESHEYYRNRLLPDNVKFGSEGYGRYIYYGYDSQFQITSIKDEGVSAGAYEFLYNRAGRRIELKRPHSPHARTTYGYSDKGYPLKIRHRFGEQYDQYYNIEYDEGRYDSRGNPGRLQHTYENLTPIDTDGIDLGIAAKNAIPAWEEHVYDDVDRLIFSKARGLRNGLTHNILESLTGVLVRHLMPGSVILTAPYLYNRQRIESEVRTYYAYDDQGRQVIKHLELIPEPGGNQNDHKHLIYKRKYGSGQAVAKEDISWYESTLSTPKTIVRKYTYDLKGRRKMVEETPKDQSTWIRAIRYFYGMGDKPELIRKFARDDDNVDLKEEQFIEYDPMGRRVFLRTVTYDIAPLVEHQWQSLMTERRPSGYQGWEYRSMVKSDNKFYYGYVGQDMVGIYGSDGIPMAGYLNGPAANERLARWNRGLGERIYHLNHQQNAAVFTESDGDVDNWVPQSATYGGATQQIPENVKLGMWGHITDFLTTTFREYDPGIGQFISPDPVGLAASFNRYNFADGNPNTKNDPSGLAAESPWDAASLGMGLASLAGNIATLNVGGALVDLVGIGADAVALAVPGVPGGAGAGIKAYRATDAMVSATRAADKLNDFPTHLMNDVAISQLTLKQLQDQASIHHLMQGHGRVSVQIDFGARLRPVYGHNGLSNKVLQYMPNPNKPGELLAASSGFPKDLKLIWSRGHGEGEAVFWSWAAGIRGEEAYRASVKVSERLCRFCRHRLPTSLYQLGVREFDVQILNEGLSLARIRIPKPPFLDGSREVWTEFLQKVDAVSRPSRRKKKIIGS